jgi:hypothetical protein
MWPVWSNRGMSTFIYSPKEDVWRSYKDYASAFVKMARETKTEHSAKPYILPFEVSQIGYTTPKFTNDGRACYLDENNKTIWAYEGDRWHEWSRNDITGEVPSKTFTNPPFYDDHKNLTVNIDDYAAPKTTPASAAPAPARQTFRWKQTYPPTSEASASGWLPGPYAAGPEDAATKEKAADIRLPEGCPNPDFLSIVQCKPADFWFTSKGILYRFHNNICETIVPKGYANPFNADVKLNAVYIDPHGSVFADANAGDRRMCVIIPANTK